MLRDYAPGNTDYWTPGEREGLYQIEVSVRNSSTGETSSAILPYEVVSRVGAGVPVINSTIHPLVFLYSAPPCPVGARMKVQFRPSEGVNSTPFKACQKDVSMNFYLAGMRAETEYTARHILESDSQSIEGPELKLTTRAVEVSIPSYKVLTPP